QAVRGVGGEDDRPQPLARTAQGRRGGDRGLADAALPGVEDGSGAGQLGTKAERIAGTRGVQKPPAAAIRCATGLSHLKGRVFLKKSRFTLLALVLALAAAAVAACGGDDEGDGDPADLLRTALTEAQNIESAVMDLSIDGKLE